MPDRRHSDDPPDKPIIVQLGDPRSLDGGVWTLMPTPEGTCGQCAVDHEPDQPHNQQSLAYQYHFYAEHQRWPTWRDAMAHCTEQVREHWIRALAERGVDVDAR